MSEDLLTAYQTALDNEEPIEVCGFTLHPITMRDYRLFAAAKNALLIRQGSLPAKYAVMRYLSALYAMDYDAAKENGKPHGFIGGVLTVLALAMRYPVDAVLRRTTIQTAENNERELVRLSIHTGDGILHLTPTAFDRMRPILAAQNGLELPDETENADLVEAEEVIAAQNAPDVEFDFRTMVASVARDQRMRSRELMEYSIREFSELRDAIERDKLYMLYKTGELSGTVKFKDGNPVPSWCFAARKTGNSMIAMSEFMARHGGAAAQH